MLGRGAGRMSSRELMFEMQQLRTQGIAQAVRAAPPRSSIGERLSAETKRRLQALKEKK